MPKNVTLSITVIGVDDDVRKVEWIKQLLSGYSEELLKKIDQYIRGNNISYRGYQLEIETKEVIKKRIILNKEVLSNDSNSKKKRHYTTILRHKYNYYSKIAGKKIKNQKEAIDAFITRIYELENYIYELEKSLSHR